MSNFEGLMTLNSTLQQVTWHTVA